MFKTQGALNTRRAQDSGNSAWRFSPRAGRDKRREAAALPALRPEQGAYGSAGCRVRTSAPRASDAGSQGRGPHAARLCLALRVLPDLERELLGCGGTRATRRRHTTTAARHKRTHIVHDRLFSRTEAKRIEPRSTNISHGLGLA